MFICKKVMTIDVPVRILYTFFMPDRRPRDLSNYLKCTEDLLVKRGIIIDDNHTLIPEFTVKFGGYDRQFPRVEIEAWKA